MLGKTYITTGERIRSYLGIGFVISLVINAAGTPFYPNLNARQENVPPEIVTVQREHHEKPPTPPPPTPTPPPQKPVEPKHALKPKPLTVNIPKTHNNPSVSETEPRYEPVSGSPSGVPSAPGNESPSPATATPGTPKPACSTPNQDATVANPMQPDYPESAKDIGLGPVTVLVAVTIGAQGQLLDAQIYQSSHNAAIDEAAIRAARQSQYSPRIVDCQPIEGTYLFHADFDPN
jgi:TonB family protein